MEPANVSNGVRMNTKPKVTQYKDGVVPSAQKTEIVYAEGVDPESIRPGSYEKYYFERPVKKWIPAQKANDKHMYRVGLVVACIP